MAIPFVVVVLFMSMPCSCARKPQEQPPALEFPPPLSEDLLCPPPPPSPMAFLSPEFPFSLQPPPGPEFPPPLPDDLACPPPPPPTQTQCPPTPPKTTPLYYFPPSPMTFLPPAFSFPLQPPPAPEFSSPAPSSSILGWFSGLGGAIVVALVLRCRIIRTQRAAPTQPVHVEMVAMQAEMEGPRVLVEMDII